MLDVNALLSPLSDDSPCGEDLEYDTEFGALVRATEGTPEREIGSTLVPAEDPDWKDVVARSLALTGRTKDLRVYVCLTQGLLHTDGAAGLAQGLELLHGSLADFWDCVHPQLDPEDGYDSTMRVNILGGLCHPDYVLGAMRRLPLVESPAIGRFALRDMAIAAGELAPATDEETAPPDPSTIEAAWKNAEPHALKERQKSFQQAGDELGGIDTVLREKLPAGQTPDLTPLEGILREAKQMFDQRLGPVTDTAGETGAGPGDSAVAMATTDAALTGQIAGRGDVIRALDKICDYYASNEPSSPVPLLMERAKRLVNMDFMALIQNLAPEGLSQVETIRGPEDEEKESEY